MTAQQQVQAMANKLAPTPLIESHEAAELIVNVTGCPFDEALDAVLSANKH